MKILVLESSGNKNGSSNLLAGEFIRGAKESGHEVTEFDVFRADIRPCTGCGHCGMNGDCVQKDDCENRLKPLIKETDMLGQRLRSTFTAFHDAENAVSAEGV
jgi:multimeric flavodoxin WrbA